MKRIAVLMTMIACAASPAVAQWQGMPAWNNPKGGTGITVNGDVGIPNSDAGKGTAFGARATLGLANISLTAGISSWKPNGFNSSTTSLGGVAQFRVIGGSLIPVALNIQLGAGTSSAINSGPDTLPKLTNILAGAGLSVNVPTPGLSIEPYLSVSNRWHKASGFSTESNIGWVLGANVGFGMLGVHLAYDSEKLSGGGTAGVLGIGVHVALKAPIGL
jgi:opacity protein-like surface antigen